MIYRDNSNEIGLPTRVFREVPGGIEWMYAIDRSAGSDRWFTFYPGIGKSIADLQMEGKTLIPVD